MEKVRAEENHCGKPAIIASIHHPKAHTINEKPPHLPLIM